MKANVLKRECSSLIVIAAMSLVLAGCAEKEKEAAPAYKGGAETLKATRSKEDYQEAIRNFKELIKKEPENVMLIVSLGNAYFDVGMDLEAIVTYEKALKIYPDNVSARTDLGTAYRRSGQPDKALEQYKKSLAIDPRHSITRYNIGVVLLWDKNDIAGAIRTWEELLRIDPYFVLADEIRRNMGTLEKMRKSAESKQ